MKRYLMKMFYQIEKYTNNIFSDLQAPLHTFSTQFTSLINILMLITDINSDNTYRVKDPW